MSAILLAAGFKNLESLHRFSLRYFNVANELPEDLQHIWISHDDLELIPHSQYTYKGEPSYTEYCRLLDLVEEKSRIASSELTPRGKFEPIKIFKQICKHFNAEVTEYILTKCQVFYNWGINCLEPVINVAYVYEKIEQFSKRSMKTKVGSDLTDFKRWRYLAANLKRKRGHSDEVAVPSIVADSPDLFEEAEAQLKKHDGRRKRLKYDFRKLKEIHRKYDVPFREIEKNESDPSQETFLLNKILYDIKQRPRWPEKHVLSQNNVDELVKCIIQVDLKEGCLDFKNELLYESTEWITLRKILKHLLETHRKLNVNSGYGRILKRHLKSFQEDTLDRQRRLIAIPKRIVSSFVIDILRRALPLEFFGSNNTSKKIFREIIRIINGAKDESFVWHSVIRHFSGNGNDVKWCKEIKDEFSKERMMVKTVKWLIWNYLFRILRNQFYITEAGNTNFGLVYYRKSDMESVSHFALNDKLYYKELSLVKSHQWETWTMERKWLETGTIAAEDLEVNRKKKMLGEDEFVQPVANVRFLPKNDSGDAVRVITSISVKKVIPPNGDVRRRKLFKVFVKRSYRRSKKMSNVKLLLEFLVNEIGTGIKPVPGNPRLEAAWHRALSIKQIGSLYFVKVDIADAFGSVSHSKLNDVLASSLKAFDCLQLKRIREWRLQKGKVRMSSRFSFSDCPRENVVVASRSALVHSRKKLPSHSVQELKKILNQVIFKQRLKINGKIFHMKQGLAQGSAGKFSPLLCEIYYSAMDRYYFSDLLNSNDSLLLRGVDDYLLLTSSHEKAENFYSFMKGGVGDFNVRINEGKLATNVTSDVTEFTFLGLIFNVDDMTVQPSYARYEKSSLLATMKLSDTSGDIHFRKTRALDRRAIRIVCLKLQPILLNDLYNGISVIRRVIFSACLMQVSRILCLSRHLFEPGTQNDLDICVVLCRSLSKITKHVQRFVCLPSEEINWLFYHAAELIVKRFGQYKQLRILIESKKDICELNFVRTNQDMVLDFLKADVSKAFPNELLGVLKKS